MGVKMSEAPPPKIAAPPATARMLDAIAATPTPAKNEVGN